MNIFQVISKLDIFGQPINLNLDLKSKYQSVFGGLVSVFIVIVLISYSINEIVGYTTNRSISITQETKFYYDPDLLELNQDNFIFAIRIEQEQFYNQPWFDIIVTQEDNGVSNTIDLQKCQFSQFSTVLPDNIDTKQFFDANEVGQWLCPSQNFTINLQGTEFSSNYKKIKFEIKQCIDTSSWNETCQVKDNQDSYRLQLITKNTFINPFNNDLVAEDYLDNSMNVYFQPGQLQRIDYSFHKHLTRDYQGQIKIQGVIDDSTEQIFSTNSFKQIYEGDSQNVYAKILFERSNFSTRYNREYQTVTDLLSKIGGLSQSVVGIVGVIITYYNRAQFYLDISNRLYDYDFNSESDQQTRGSGAEQHLQIEEQLGTTSQPLKKSRRKKRKDEAIQNKDKINENKTMDSIKNDNDSQDEDPEFKDRVLKIVEDQKKFMQQYSFKNRKHFLLAAFQQTILMKSSISLSLKYFFNLLLCKKAHPKKDPKLFILQKALTSVRQELDVFSILNRIHQVEKIKKILLDKDQLNLFNFTPKPIIAINDKDKESNFFYYSKQQTFSKQTLSEIADDIKKQWKNTFSNENQSINIETIFNSYAKIASKNKQSNRFYYKINRKLKQFLGDQVSAIIKASKLLQFPGEREFDMGTLELQSIGIEARAQQPLHI